ncbi:hypothetical protein TCAL_01395 [Tigriopus californicus]|uniref:Uncharacterized protein n=1 Tax=Tigriopus californicus TaxID=6832 RepID=A0A553NUW6_TIGCA|nr:hypothetical protein TCAL_01395 [Tigriopus californicus]
MLLGIPKEAEVSAQQNRCGLVPTEVFLKKGERKQLIFWTDQNYENLTTAIPLEATTESSDGVDSFLEAVNGGLPIPSTSSNDTESYPEFLGQPEVSFTTTLPPDESTEQDTPITTTAESITTVNTEKSLDTTTVPIETTTLEIAETTTDTPIMTTVVPDIEVFNELNVTTEKISILKPSAVVTQPPDLEGEVVQVLIASTIKMEDLTTTMEPVETTTTLHTTTAASVVETTTLGGVEESTEVAENTTDKLEVIDELVTEDHIQEQIAELQDEILLDDSETEDETTTTKNDISTETSSVSDLPTSTIENSETSTQAEAEESTIKAVDTQESNVFETTTSSDGDTDAPMMDATSHDDLQVTEATTWKFEDLILDDDTNEEGTESVELASSGSTTSTDNETMPTSAQVEQFVTEAPANLIEITSDVSDEDAKENKIDANLIPTEIPTTTMITTEETLVDQLQVTESSVVAFDSIHTDTEEAAETTTYGDSIITQTSTSDDDEVITEASQLEDSNESNDPVDELEDIILDDDSVDYSETEIVAAHAEVTSSNQEEATESSTTVQLNGSEASANDAVTTVLYEEGTTNIDTSTAETTPSSTDSSTTDEVNPEEQQLGEIEAPIIEIVDIILNEEIAGEEIATPIPIATTTDNEIEVTTTTLASTIQSNEAEELMPEEIIDGDATKTTTEEYESTTTKNTVVSEIEIGIVEVNTQFPSNGNLEVAEAPTETFDDIILDDDSYDDDNDEKEVATETLGSTFIPTHSPTSSESQTNHFLNEEGTSVLTTESTLALESDSEEEQIITDHVTVTSVNEMPTISVQETTTIQNKDTASSDLEVTAMESAEQMISQMETTDSPTSFLPESTTESKPTVTTEIVTTETTENAAIVMEQNLGNVEDEIQYDDPEGSEEQVTGQATTVEAETESMKDQSMLTEPSTTPETTPSTTEKTFPPTGLQENSQESLNVKNPDENALNADVQEAFQITEEGLGAVLANIISKIQEEAFGSESSEGDVSAETEFAVEIRESTRNKTQEVEVLLPNGEKVVENVATTTVPPQSDTVEKSTEPNMAMTNDISEDILYDDESSDIEKTMVFIVPDDENSLSPSVLSIPEPDVITKNLTSTQDEMPNLPEAQPQIVPDTAIKTGVFQDTTTGSSLDGPFFAPVESEPVRLEPVEFKDTTTGSPLDDPQKAKEDQSKPIFAAIELEDVEEAFEFSYTTTGSPLDDPQEAKEDQSKPIFAAIELEDVEEAFEFSYTTTGSPLDDPQEAKEDQSKPIFAAVELEDIEEAFEFTDTTTGSTLDNDPQQDREDFPLNFAAIVEEETNIEFTDAASGSSNDLPVFAPIEVDPLPFEFTDTTTGAPLVKKISSNGSVVDIDQSGKVDGPLDLENIQYYDDPEDYQSGFSEDTKTSLSQSKLGTAQRLDLVLNKPSEDLERMTRKEDEDAIVDAQGLQDLSPYQPKINTSDPGSLLTTILDGILSSKPRPPPHAPQLSQRRTTVKPLPIIVTEEAPLSPTTDDGFPVSNLLNGIYRLVSSYITPRPTMEPFVTELDFTPPESTTSQSISRPINVHNTRREDLDEKVDNQYSKTDPFVQLQAPDLRMDGNSHDQDMLFPVPLPKESVSTFSPFNSPALKIQKPPQIQGPRNKEELAGPLPISAPVGDVPNAQEIFYPGNYLRGGSTSQKETKSASKPKIGPSSAPYLSLVDNQRNRDPVSIPLPGLLSDNENNYRRDPKPSIEDNTGYDAIGSIRRKEESFYRFINAQPLPIQRGILDPANRDQRSRRQLDETSPPEKEISSTDSAPFTVDCQGAYIEVERENNGFEARWCGNRGGSRPHVIFAKNEVRISVFDDGSLGKELPTGFSADVEVIDLYDGEQYSNLSKTNAYSNMRVLKVSNELKRTASWIKVVPDTSNGKSKSSSNSMSLSEACFIKTEAKTSPSS